ncbi:hypothetical protein HHK36_005389 [Tetracentron sinense]|uniref:Epidermal patterning factor-like protein n=1 Tax=Tetracentron sinense TaxID=13715 RepID=A0A834ZPC8_TETSI|nr:hypothetical protein HHK36_005389 [Tetracentron sinense]
MKSLVFVAAFLAILILVPTAISARHIDGARSHHDGHNPTRPRTRDGMMVKPDSNREGRPIKPRKPDTLQIAGSSLPDCSHACGSCTPCRLVMAHWHIGWLESKRTTANNGGLESQPGHFGNPLEPVSSRVSSSDAPPLLPRPAPLPCLSNPPPRGPSQDLINPNFSLGIRSKKGRKNPTSGLVAPDEIKASTMYPFLLISAQGKTPPPSFALPGITALIFKNSNLILNCRRRFGSSKLQDMSFMALYLF